MAQYNTRKSGNAAKRTTIANRRARAVKRGSTAFNKSGRPARTVTTSQTV